MSDTQFTERILRVITASSQRLKGFPDPTTDVDSLYRTVSALKEATETLLRSRGVRGDSAVLVKELEPFFNAIDQLITDRLEAADIATLIARIDELQARVDTNTAAIESLSE
jgi:hypothetical protein